MAVSYEHYEGKLILTLRKIRRSCKGDLQGVWFK